jgi:hypothetical protein
VNLLFTVFFGFALALMGLDIDLHIVLKTIKVLSQVNIKKLYVIRRFGSSYFIIIFIYFFYGMSEQWFQLTESLAAETKNLSG